MYYHVQLVRQNKEFVSMVTEGSRSCADDVIFHDIFWPNLGKFYPPWSLVSQWVQEYRETPLRKINCLIGASSRRHPERKQLK